MKTAKQVPLWKTALKIGLIFGCIFIFLELVMRLIMDGSLDYYHQRLGNGRWVYYLIGRLVMSIGYGFFIAYLNRNNTKKR